MSYARILVIDDEEIIRQLLARALGEKGYFVEAVEDGGTAIEKIRNNNFDLLITDLKMPKINGMEVLRELKKVNPYVEVIIITGYPTIESAVEAIKIGAFDFICKPFDIEGILSIIGRSLEKQKHTLSHFRLSEIKILFEANKTITTTPNLDDLLARILDAALEIAKAKRGSILLIDEQTQELRIRVARGLSQEIIDNTRIKIGEGISGRLAQEGVPIFVKNIEEDSRFQKESNPQYGTKSFIGIPLASIPIRSKRNILGVINISDKVSGDSFTEREETLLSVLAGQSAVAIENYQLYSQLEDKVELLERAIKELEEAQNQLIQSEKMAAVGQLAFGIAHEIRNPLGIILGGVEFLKGNVPAKDEVITISIEKIKLSIERANRIIIDLLKFSRASQLELQTINICQIMDEVISLIKNQAYLNGVEINRDYIEQGLRVQADPNLLRQAFFNLSINAIEAMPEGGELLLSICSQQNAEQNEINAIVEIADTGRGIPEDILPKIFEPFFTTKEPGAGTGLGLSIVHMILKRHNGSINVESKVNAGTKFTIKLPVERSPNYLSEEETQIVNETKGEAQC